MEAKIKATYCMAYILITYLLNVRRCNIITFVYKSIRGLLLTWQTLVPRLHYSCQGNDKLNHISKLVFIRN